MDGRRRQIRPHGLGLFAARNKQPERRLTDSDNRMILHFFFTKLSVSACPIHEKGRGMPALAAV